MVNYYQSNLIAGSKEDILELSYGGMANTFPELFSELHSLTHIKQDNKIHIWVYLPTGINGLKERLEARENEKIGLGINNSFLNVQGNYTFTEVATRFYMNSILKAESNHNWLFERQSRVHVQVFFLLLQLSLSDFLSLYVVFL